MEQPYREKNVEDIEYKTPKKPWHESTSWFITGGTTSAASWTFWNVAAIYGQQHCVLWWNMAVAGFLTGVVAITTLIVAVNKRFYLK